MAEQIERQSETEITRCPCCDLQLSVAKAVFRKCTRCGHQWRSESASQVTDYSLLSQRNRETSAVYLNKINDRMNDIEQIIFDGAYVLETGCAEGGLGAELKQRYQVRYDGIEPSRDASIAAQRLDNVYGDISEIASAQRYDIVMSFHVLEHIADVLTALRLWASLLNDTGQLLIEVPNGAGNPLLACDHHPEHLHQFSLMSLVSLVQRSYLEIVSVTSGHFESTLYRDSLRLVARAKKTESQRQLELQKLCQRLLPEPVLIYGVGGDFHNWVKPLMPFIHVQGLRDGAATRQGECVEGYIIDTFSPETDLDSFILVTSFSYENEIVRNLEAMGMGSQQIVTLSDIYGA
jgi:2-polyprenyl-3-methyl-5-hydroxy-6-metoxy-1,4-benzoquinol methylase